MKKRIILLISITVAWVLINVALMGSTDDASDIPFYSWIILAILWGIAIEFTKKEHGGDKKKE